MSKDVEVNVALRLAHHALYELDGNGKTWIEFQQVADNIKSLVIKTSHLKYTLVRAVIIDVGK